MTQILANTILSATWCPRRSALGSGGPAAVLFSTELFLGPRMGELELLYEFQPRGFWTNRNALEYVRRTRGDPFMPVYIWIGDVARYWGGGAPLSPMMP